MSGFLRRAADGRASVGAAGRRVFAGVGPIPGFMAAMEMSYPVATPSLLSGVNPGARIEFTIDAGRAVITAIKVIAPAR